MRQLAIVCVLALGLSSVARAEPYALGPLAPTGKIALSRPVLAASLAAPPASVSPAAAPARRKPLSFVPPAIRVRPARRAAYARHPAFDDGPSELSYPPGANASGHHRSLRRYRLLSQDAPSVSATVVPRLDVICSFLLEYSDGGLDTYDVLWLSSPF